MVDDISREFEKSGKGKEKNLSEEGRLKVFELIRRKGEAKTDKWFEQKKRRDEDLAKEIKKITEGKPQAKLEPAQAKWDKFSKKDVERRAIRNVADNNRLEMARLDKIFDEHIKEIYRSEGVVKKEKGRDDGRGR